jgi:hypothetical protein
MNFDHAWTFAGKPRGETPAPPGKRTPVLPRLPPCRALFRQTGKCIFRAMLAVFRTGRRQHLAFGEYVLGPGVPHLAAQPKRHGRRLSHPPPSHKHALEISGSAYRTAQAGLGRPTPTGLFLLVGGFGNWFGFLERRVATQGGIFLCGHGWRETATKAKPGRREGSQAA